MPKNKSEVKIEMINKNRSITFYKKDPKELFIKPLKYMEEPMGRVRHFTPAAQEWYNSVYTYNRHYTKTLPTADNNLIKLLKSYFNQKIKIKNKEKKSKNKKFIFLNLKKENDKKSLLMNIKKRLNKFFELSLENKDKIIRYKLMYLKNKNLRKFKALSIKKEDEKEEKSKSTLFFRKFRLKEPKLYRRYKKPRIRKERTIKTRKTIKKSKFLSTKKVFVGKGNLKHTNDKVVITFFLFNAKRMYIFNKYRKEKKKLFYPSRAFRKYFLKSRFNKKITVTLRRAYNMYEFLAGRKLYVSYRYFIKEWIKIYNKQLKKINKVMDINNFYILNSEERIRLLKIINRGIFNIYYPKYSYYKRICCNHYLKKLLFYNKLLAFNKKKHKYSFLFKFIPLIENLYRKQVVFNIVNLKKLHLSSDIYTQMLSNKLRDRDNKPYKVLKKFMHSFRFKSIRRPIRAKRVYKLFNKFKVNNIRNSLVKSMFNNTDYEYKKYYYLNKANTTRNLQMPFQDPLSNLLLRYFNITNNYVQWKRTNKRSKVWVKREFSRKVTWEGRRYTLFKKRKKEKIYRKLWNTAYDVITFNHILKNLKYKKLRGIRVEAKGRLTRRRTASRSVYKMKYLGGLRNIRASFRRLPSIMLRGDKKSNVEYTFVSSNGRNGAFGIKGWVGSF